MTGSIAGTSHYRCCWKDGNSAAKCGDRKATIKDAFHCEVDVNNGNALSAYLEDCNGQKSNEVQLQVSCSEASAQVKARMKGGKAYYFIYFDKPVVKLSHDSCKPFVKVSK